MREIQNQYDIREYDTHLKNDLPKSGKELRRERRKLERRQKRF